MLIGSHNHNVDDKGRLFLPAKFRSELGNEIILSKGIDNCIYAFSIEAWEEFAKKLSALPMTNKLAQLFMRKLYASAVEREADKQGRVLLTPELKKYAKIEKETTIIGMNNRVEIWSKSGFEEYESTNIEEYEQAIESLSELGI